MDQTLDEKEEGLEGMGSPNVVKVDGGKATITWVGKLSADNAHELDDMVFGLPESVKDIDVDLSRTFYVSSAGLRVFVKANKLCGGRGGKLRLLNPQSEVAEMFHMTGLDALIDIVRGEKGKTEGE